MPRCMLLLTDSQSHQFIHHLATHFCMESIALARNNYLSRSVQILTYLNTDFAQEIICSASCWSPIWEAQYSSTGLGAFHCYKKSNHWQENCFLLDRKVHWSCCLKKWTITIGFSPISWLREVSLRMKVMDFKTSFTVLMVSGYGTSCTGMWAAQSTRLTPQT